MNRTLAVLGVVAILGTAFYAGQKSFGITVDYDHADVINAVQTCNEGQYIGSCSDCQACNAWSYAAGGCSYFKDTLCTLCSQIDHCNTHNVVCSNEYDQTCLACDAGYYIDGQECLQCSVCPAGQRVTKECDENSDTVCEPCTSCDDGYFVSRECKVDTATNSLLPVTERGVYLEDDTQCEQCTACVDGEFPSANCVEGDIENQGADTECGVCSGCEHATFATQICDKNEADTECNDCGGCEAGQYIQTPCQPGSPFDEDRESRFGVDTLCADCTPRGDNEWTVFPCDPLHTTDAVHQECTQCSDGEYMLAACGETSDTVCPHCPGADDTLFLGDSKYPSGLQYCSRDAMGESQVRCEAEINEAGIVSAGRSKCGEWEDLPMIKVAGKMQPMNPDKCRYPHSDPDSKCGEWKSYCDEGFLGEACCYHKHPASCGTLTTRERSSHRHGYVQGTNFADFCRELCDQFPDCMAFEIEKDADGGVCHFKAAYSQSDGKWLGHDESLECWSNTCRHNSYYEKNGKTMATINYDTAL